MTTAILICIALALLIALAVWLDIYPEPVREYEPVYLPHTPFDPTVDLTMIRLVGPPPYDWSMDDECAE